MIQPGGSDRRELGMMAAVLGLVYFAQGISEPGEGLLSQGLRTLWRREGGSHADIAWRSLLLTLPWTLKPIFGVLCDRLARVGIDRLQTLVASGVLAGVSLFAASIVLDANAETSSMVFFLMAPAVAVALGDVAADAAMIEVGQRRRNTGLLQSVQWGSLLLASIVAGGLGGLLSEARLQRFGLILGAILSLLASAAARLGWVHGATGKLHEMQANVDLAEQATETPSANNGHALAPVALLIALANFDLVSNSLLQWRGLDRLQVSESTYGLCVSITAVGGLLAALRYGAWSRHRKDRDLFHSAIFSAVFAALAPALAIGSRTLGIANFASGYFYFWSTLCQLDLVARRCPARHAGMVFSAMMALSNLSMALGGVAGGLLVDHAQMVTSPVALSGGAMILFLGIIESIVTIAALLASRALDDSPT